MAAFALIALALALVVFFWLRKKWPESRWSEVGKVDARRFDIADFVVVGAVMALMLSGLLFQDSAPPAGTETPAPSVEAEDGSAPKASNLLMFVYVLVLHGMLLGCLLAYMALMRGFNLVETFGLKRLGPLKAIGIPLVSIIPVMILVLLVARLSSMLFPDGGAQQAVEEFMQTSDSGVQIRIALAAVLIAPIWEETLFRGFIYPVVKKYTEPIFAAVFSGLVFSIVHFHVPGLLPLWALGILLALAYEWTGSLWVPIILHALFNGIMTVQMLRESGAF